MRSFVHCVAPLLQRRSLSTIAALDASKLTIERTKNPKAKLPKEQLKFGQLLSDHMLDVDWDATNGWHAPRIIPYQPLQLDPAASSLHYGLQCFEGMKAYLDNSNKIRLFRPDKNMDRINSSMARLCMPNFHGPTMVDLIKTLVKVERDWIPTGEGYSLYIRPTAIATTPVLGVSPARHIKFYVILSPVGPYYPTGFNPIKLLADPKYVRAWPGGTGNAKVGGNYAMGILPQQQAAQRGFAQLLWLFGPEHYVTEVGTMNQFFFWVNAQGEKELLTAPLDGTILPGVTRDSILSLARKWGEFKVTERPYTITELVDAIKENRMIEAFGAGTAAVVSPVEGFQYNDEFYRIPLGPKAGAKAGPLTQKVWDTLTGIQYGKIPHEWSVLVD